MVAPHAKHHRIVAIDTQFFNIPDLKPSDEQVTYELEQHYAVKPTEVPALIKDATILITSTVHLPASTLSAETCPKLEFITCAASGTDSIDLQTCRERGIKVSNCRQANRIAVAEHAIGLYFSVRRKVVQTHTKLRKGQWKHMGGIMEMMKGPGDVLPLSCSQEVMGIVGYGAIGQRIAMLAGALGMDVLVAERKGAESCRDGRVAFSEVVAKSSVIVLALPRNPESLNTLGPHELSSMRQDAIVINISRGGLIDEVALLDALKMGQVAGAATDVYTQEPAGPDSSPLTGEQADGLNLVTTPHTAWVGQSTRLEQSRMIKDNVEAWCAGSQINVVV